MSKYQVEITGSALHDMESIYDYIANSLLSPDTALKQYNQIADAIESLADFSFRCPAVSQANANSLRRLLIGRYSFFI